MRNPKAGQSRSDEELDQALQGLLGDQQTVETSLDVIARRLGEVIRAYVANYLMVHYGSDGEDAKDVVNDLFLRILDGAARPREWRGPAAMRSWLFTLAHRIASQRRNGPRAHEPLGEQQQDQRPIPDADLEVKEQRDWVRRGWRNVSATNRVVIQLHLSDKMTLGAVARKLGIAAATARKRYQRGLSQFRYGLSDQDPEPEDEDVDDRDPELG